MNLGVIGLGQLGTPVARNLLKAKHTVYIHDLNKDTATKLLSEGAIWADSPAAVAQNAETVFTVLPTPQASDDVVRGENGILSGATAGKTWIELSTNDRNLLIELEKVCNAQGVHMLESPMTGGIPYAHQGLMTMLVGGQKEVFDAQKHLLEIIGGKIFHLGAVGSSTIAKIITNMLAAIHLWSLGEALVLGTKAGLDTGILYESIKASCGNSFVAETEGPQILNGSYDYGFTFELQAKDANLVYELGREMGVPLEMGSHVEQIIQRAKAKYGGDAWSTGIVRLLEDETGVQARAEGYPLAGHNS